MKRRRLGSHPHIASPPNDTHLQGESRQIEAAHVPPANHNVTIFANVSHVLTRSYSVTAKSKLALPLIIIF